MRPPDAVSRAGPRPRRRSSSFLALFLAEGSAERPSSQDTSPSRKTLLSSRLPVVLFKFVLIVLRYYREIVAGATSAHSNDDASVGTARDTHTHTHIRIRARERDSQTHTVRRPWCPARTEWKKERERARRRHVPARTHRRGRLLVLRERVVSRPDRADPLLPPTTRRSFLPSAPAEFVKPKRHRRARTTAFRR